MISLETIALVKERTDLVALIGDTVRLTRRGRSFTGLCPFHKEKTPSFHVNAERAFFHCFGCKESGSAIDFLIKSEGLSFPEAVRSLAERAGVEITETLTDVERHEANAARRAKEDLYAVNHLAATFFERSLRSAATHPLARYALEELARRGLSVPERSREGEPPADLDQGGGPSVGVVAPLPSQAKASREGGGTSEPTGPVGDTLQAFRIGYAPYGWDSLATFLRQQGVSPLAAERVGLLVPRSSGSGYYDRFRHRLMFAVIDVMGRVVAFSGRSLPEPSPAELTSLGLPLPSPKPLSSNELPPTVAKYMNSPESPIYIKGDHLFGLHQARHAIRQRGEAILVEGNFDVVGLHARGITHVVAPLGTAFTPAQAKLLKRFAPTVTVLFDPDAAGRKATRAARGPCREAGLNVKVATLPTGIDPDEFARKQGADGIARVIKGASGMLEHLIYEALESGRFGGATLAEQHARVRAVAALLAEEDDPSLRLMAKTYADRLSSQLVLEGRSPSDLHQLEHIIQHATSRHGDHSNVGAPAPVPHDRARSPLRVEEIGLYVLGVILDFPELLDDPEVQVALSTLDGAPALAIAAARQNRSAQMGLYADEFLAQIPGSIHPFAAGRLASPAFDAAGEAKEELLKNAHKLRRLSLMREKAAVAEDLHRAEALGDIASEETLMRDAQRRTREKLGLA